MIKMSLCRQSTSLQQVPHKHGRSANTDCPEPWTVESLWKQSKAKVSREGLKEKPGLPYLGTVRTGKRGRPTHWGCFFLLAEFAEASGSLSLELRLKSDKKRRPHFHGDEES